VTKGVSNVTGRDDPLLQNVIRSRKNKNLFTFWNAVWESLSRNFGQIARFRTKSHSRQDYTGRL
jgi:hypothetical protein